jgi:NAD(P)-dependent dehydrogenase (short-subunit alcohol dehydrogenase family)
MVPAMRGLQGKSVIVVAGGSRPDRPSIGGASAQRLAAEGASVVVADIDLTAAQATVDAIVSGGGTATAVPCDVSDEGSVNDAIAFTVATYGGLDGVHSNAMDMSEATLGIDGEHTVVTLPLEVWQRTLDVGLTGFFLVCRAAIPHLVARGGGAIVGTASAAVYAGEPIRVGYATAKTGMTAIVRHIATAYGRQGVRATAIAPGSVLSAPAAEALDPERLGHHRARSNRLGRPDDIAGMVAFLISDDGAWITGHTISVDGGALLRT